ncbi:MAG: hypothetical protein RIQ66_890 [Pseudomonadota bacterium]|jgi:tRNA (guanine-N7-)-methyltransferase
MWGLTFRKEPIDLQEVFGRTGPIVLEIGFGMGETTARIARQHPEWNILAADVYRPGVGALLAKIDQEQLTNIRIVEWDAVEVLEHMLASNSLDAVHIYFPDPWPKKRHHKRRLIQAPFIELLVSRLRSGGVIHLATDWPEYADQMLAVCSDQPQLRNQFLTGFAPRPTWRPQTKFEARGLRLGHPVADLLFQKI